jgi:hypothetical protein
VPQDLIADIYSRGGAATILLRRTMPCRICPSWAFPPETEGLHVAMAASFCLTRILTPARALRTPATGQAARLSVPTKAAEKLTQVKRCAAAR